MPQRRSKWASRLYVYAFQKAAPKQDEKTKQKTTITEQQQQQKKTSFLTYIYELPKS